MDYILEIATNEYWTRNLQGIQAMLFYMYLRGVILIVAGDNPYIVRETFISLLPEDCQNILEEACQDDDYSIQFVPKVKEKIELDRKRWEKEAEKEELEKKRLSQKFYAFSPVFRNPKLLEKLQELEKELIENLSDQSIVTILRYSSGRGMINRCFYGLSNAARLKMLNCGYGEELFEMSKFQRMECVLEMGEQGEEEILGSVMMMLGTIKRLRRMGTIGESYGVN